MKRKKISPFLIALLTTSIFLSDTDQSHGAVKKNIFSDGWYKFSISQDLSKEKNINKININGVVNFKDCQTKAVGEWQNNDGTHKYKFHKSSNMKAEAVNTDEKGYVPIDAIDVEIPPLLTVVNTLLDVEKDDDKRGVACSFKIFEKYGSLSPNSKEIVINKKELKNMRNKNMSNYIKNLNLSYSTTKNLMQSTGDGDYSLVIDKLRIKLVENGGERRFYFYIKENNRKMAEVTFIPTNINKINKMDIKSFNEDYMEFNKTYRTEKEKTDFIDNYIKIKLKLASKTF